MEYVNNMNKLKILCPFCNKEWTAEMLIQMEDAGIGCSSCYIPHIKGKIEIRCDNCQKIVYIKEYDEFD